MKSTSGRNNGFRKVAKWVLGVAAVAGVASGNVLANEAAETPEPTAVEQPSVVEQPAAEPVSENPPAADVTEKESPSKEPVDKQTPSPEVTEKESPSKEPMDKQTPAPDVTEKAPVIVEEEPEEQSTGLFSCFQSSKKKKNKKNMRGTNSRSHNLELRVINNLEELDCYKDIAKFIDYRSATGATNTHISGNTSVVSKTAGATDDGATKIAVEEGSKKKGTTTKDMQISGSTEGKTNITETKSEDESKTLTSVTEHSPLQSTASTATPTEVPGA